MAEHPVDVAGGPREDPPTDDDYVVVSTSQDGVRTVRLNRPASRNALSAPLRAALMTALTEAASDPVVRCVVVRSTTPPCSRRPCP